MWHELGEGFEHSDSHLSFLHVLLGGPPVHQCIARKAVCALAEAWSTKQHRELLLDKECPQCLAWS